MTLELWAKFLPALIYCESRGNPDAVSPDGGAVGILQVRAIAVRDVNEHYGLALRWPQDFLASTNPQGAAGAVWVSTTTCVCACGPVRMPAWRPGRGRGKKDVRAAAGVRARRTGRRCGLRWRAGGDTSERFHESPRREDAT